MGTLLMQTFVARNDIKLSREMAANGKTFHGSTRTLKVPVLNLVGDNSPHVDATVNFNGKLDPKLCTWLKLQDSSMIIEEQPTKVAQSIRLFLQGLGYCMRMPKGPI